MIHSQEKFSLHLDSLDDVKRLRKNFQEVQRQLIKRPSFGVWGHSSVDPYSGGERHGGTEFVLDGTTSGTTDVKLFDLYMTKEYDWTNLEVFYTCRIRPDTTSAFGCSFSMVPFLRNGTQLSTEGWFLGQEGTIPGDIYEAYDFTSSLILTRLPSDGKSRAIPAGRYVMSLEVTNKTSYSSIPVDIYDSQLTIREVPPMPDVEGG